LRAIAVRKPPRNHRRAPRNARSSASKDVPISRPAIVAFEQSATGRKREKKKKKKKKKKEGRGKEERKKKKMLGSMHARWDSTGRFVSYDFYL